MSIVEGSKPKLDHFLPRVSNSTCEWMQQYRWIRCFALQLPQELQWLCRQIDQRWSRKTERFFKIILLTKLLSLKLQYLIHYVSNFGFNFFFQKKMGWYQFSLAKRSSFTHQGHGTLWDSTEKSKDRSSKVTSSSECLTPGFGRNLKALRTPN